MTPAEVAAILRQFNEWRRGDYAPSEQPEPPNPYEVGLAIDAAVEMIERLEAAEKERDWHAERCEDAMNECGELRAKIAEMERQEPVTAQQRFQRQQEMMAVWLPWQTTELRKGRPARTVDVLGLDVEYRELYALPGAQNAPSVPTALLVAVADLVAQMEIVARSGFIDTSDDKDSCAAFCVAEGAWLELMSCMKGLAASLAAAPEAKP